MGSAVLVAFWTRKLGLLETPVGLRHASTMPWIRLGLYLPWLMWQILLSSLQVAYQVVHPKMPIDPCFVSTALR